MNIQFGKDQTLIFMHIAKAGGSTLHTIIDKEYSELVHFMSRGPKDIDKFKMLSAKEKEKIGILKGHMNFGLHELLSKSCTYITMLRDPIERVLSHYYFIERDRGHFLHKEYKSTNMNLKDFIYKTTDNDNGQTRAFAGVSDTYSLLKSEQKIIPFGECSSEIFETAKKNLKRFAVVGLMERFDETLILFKRALGWSSPPLYTKQNVTVGRPSKEDLSPDILALIEENNKFDIELYKHATNLFEEQMSQQNASFKAELIVFKLLLKSQLGKNWL